ncbi:phosphatase 1 binding protein-like protein [Euroglyphus maynei]|uniref:Phosphatase 1 binding protein-like protein n=1 Tax=Euroglyphus maynei TaxID=6958 RepID=A0A1Y3B3H9_EURMA|nr:phosphatase 1 binding protein-like protein [Euroglyphus maynei]
MKSIPILHIHHTFTLHNHYNLDFFSNIKGTNKQQQQQTAAAWLAAATQQLSDQINNHHHHQQQRKNNETTTQNTDVDNVSKPNRKTSILRTKSLSIHYEKKNVRFADTLDQALEQVRYFMISPQMPPRRYSSYTPPLNNEWNTDSWHGTGANIKTNFMQNNSRLSSIPSMKHDYLNNTMNINPRYELVIANFTIPSLSLDFSQRLFERKVLLHSLTMAETTVYGNVSVVNIHFVKKVFVRYTFDEWKTHIEREATYMLGSHDGHTDKFSFVIYARPQDFNINNNNHHHYHSSPFYHQIKSSSSNKNNNEPIAKMFFAIRFTIGDGQEFWDNNDGHNYQLDLKPF